MEAAIAQSRLSCLMRLIKKHYPHIHWIVSFADAAQCGDGTIYRAAGFSLTGITKNRSIYEFPTGQRIAQMTMSANWDVEIMRQVCEEMGVPHTYRTAKEWTKLGVKQLPGYQLRYLYFLHPTAKQRYTGEILPFSKIEEMGAGMYKGEKVSRE